MSWIQTFLQIGVSAAIGGVTNHLAIKMLFRPRNRWQIGGMGIPFTPGLIPKRQPELAKALGVVVRDYLLTPEGMNDGNGRSMLREAVIQALRNGWKEAVKRADGDEMALGTMLGVVTDLKPMLRRLYQWEEERREVWFGKMFVHLWELPMLDQPVKSLWNPEDFGPLSGRILAGLKEWLEEPASRKAIEQQVQQLIMQLGGMLGPLAAMFLNAEKLVDQFLPVVLQYADSPAMRDGLNDRLLKIWEKESDRSLRELIQVIWPDMAESEDQLKEAAKWLSGQVTFKPLIGLMLRQPVSLKWAEHQLDGIWGMLADRFLEGVPTFIRDIPLVEVVEQNVNRLSLERVEQLVFALIGREFRGITWFGVLFGAIIGAVYALIDSF